MHTVEIPLGERSYSVHIGQGILASGTLLRESLPGGQVLVVTNEVVAPLYLDTLRSSLGDHPHEVLILNDGEEHKTIRQWSEILDTLVNMGARRDSAIVALGGGVVGDISGFAAASYMRGIGYLQIPTTLLAQVDSSVGGKTAVNHSAGKNLVGAFHQPGVVLADTQTLTTLDPRQFRAGLAEVVKYGVLGDPDLFSWLESNKERINALDSESLQQMIGRCVRNKAKIVAADELEAGQRALLNLGHSFGHALEQIGQYTRFLHGEAVAMGMVVAAQLSQLRGYCSPGVSDRVAQLLSGFGLSTKIPSDIDVDSMLDAMKLDKKNTAGKTRLILLRGMGQAFVDSRCERAELEEAIRQCQA